MPKSGISTLIFCKDKIENLIDLIRDIYKISDEIVIVDSSTFKNKNLLLKRKKELKLDKVRIYPVAALGHPEPYQMYGLSKCRYDWIFYIDTDERPNEALKNNIKSIIKNSKFDVFLVRKKELDKDGKRYFDSYQRRLYRRVTARYTGNVFYDPIINGKETKLDMGYFLNHHFEYYENPAKSYNRYFIIRAYEARESYRSLLSGVKGRPIAKGFLRFYYKVKNIRPDDELTKFDYKFLQITILYFLGDVGYNIRKRKFPNLNFILHNYFYVMQGIDSFFTYSNEHRKTQLEISNEIKKSGGVINYLRMNDKCVDKLLSTYGKKDLDGVKLFTSLLLKRHFDLKTT